jgi:hypothetical protein
MIIIELQRTLISLIVLIDRSLKIGLLIFIRLPNMQEEVIVSAQNVEDLVPDVDEQSVDGIPVQPVGSLEPLVLPDREFLVHSLKELLFPTTQTHPTIIL